MTGATEPPSTRPAGSRRRGTAKAFVVAATVVLSIAYLVVGDRTVWSEWLAIWPSSGWVVLLLPATVRARSAVAASMLAVFALATTEWPRWPDVAELPGEKLRLVSWNVGADSGFFAAAADLDPDVWMLQEFARPRWLPSKFSVQASVDPAVIAKLPVEVLPTRRLGPWAEPQVLLLRLTSGRKLLLVNVRLMHPSPVLQLVDPLGQVPWRNHRERLEQYSRLVELVRETAASHDVAGTIVAGDFNTPATARSLNPLRGLLRDVWLEAGEGWGATAPEFLPLSRIDQCWVSAGIRGSRARVLRRGKSDHRLLFVELVVPS